MAIITTANLAEHLKAGGLDGTQNDVRLSNATNAANQAVVQWCGRDFDKVAEASETARVFYADSRCHVTVDDFWSTTNLVVKTDDGDDGTYETTWSSSDYQLEPLNGRENGITVPYRRIVAVEGRMFPTCSRRPSVQVSAAWGWTAVPAAVFEATLILAARLFKRTDTPFDVAGMADFGQIRLSQRDADVKALLAPFRRDENILLVG